MTLGLSSRGFRAYLVTQFLGAMNDNAFKFLLLSVIAAQAAGDNARYTLHAGVAQALFALPFVLLAGWAGVLADRHAKSSVFVVAKLVEIVLMLGVVAAFALQAYVALFVLLFLMGAQSCFFGPAKFGWLPEVLAERELSRANGLVAMTTTAAIVCGQVVGGVLHDVAPDGLATVSLVLVAVAVAGTLTSLAIPRGQPAQPDVRLSSALPELLSTLREAFATRPLLWTVLGIGHFYLLAALLQVQLFHFAQTVLGVSSGLAAGFVALSLLGIATGSLLAARWSERKVELGLVPLGALAMSGGLWLLSLTSGAAPELATADRLLAAIPALLCVILIGVGGGLFLVPLQANLQILAPERAKGRFMAFGNLVSFVGVFLSAGVYTLYGIWDLHAHSQALATALFTLGGTLIALVLLPEAFLRLCAWLLAHSFYRIRLLHPERIPARGGALLISNHVSWVDWLILLTATPRRISFLIQREYFEHWSVNWLFRLGGCVPVASGDTPEALEASLAAAGQHLREGRLVAVFAEGTVTRTGFLNPIRRGYQRIAAGHGVPIVPLHLDGLWGSVFSHERGRFLRHLPRRLPYPVTLTVGQPLGAETPPWRLRLALQRLAAEAWEDRKHKRRPLHLALLAERRRHRERVLFQPGHPPLSRGEALARALALRDHIAREAGGWGETPRVGLALPAGQSAMLALLAVHFAGRVPVLLPVADEARLAEALAAVPLELVLCDGAERLRMSAAGVPRCLDVTTLTEPGPPAPRSTRAARDPLAAPARRWRWLLACLPDRLAQAAACRGPRPGVDDPCAVLFAENSPLVVELSHHNVGSNAEALAEVFGFSREDRVAALQPPCHAVGLVAGLWLPLLDEPGVVWLPDRTAVEQAGDELARRRVTQLFAEPQDVERLLSHVRPGRLGSVRTLVSSGALLDAGLRTAFERRFGLLPLDALDITACSGLVTLNTRDVRLPGIFQRGAKAGTVGHPLPSTCVEVLLPDGAICAPDQPGALSITGPGVARAVTCLPSRSRAGVLVVPSPDDTAPPTWHSGDEAALDEEGFVTLTGRRNGPPAPDCGPSRPAD